MAGSSPVLVERGLQPAGSSSIAWRVNSERLVLFGWGRAILLQLAHPLLAAGVFDHSGFRSTPLAAAARLRHTVRAMLSLTFGDDVQRERTLDVIRDVHRRVHGTLPEAVGRFPAGTPYSAEDPALVTWVHATLVESVILAYEQFITPLTAAERDAYCAEARPTAIALAAREDDVPRTWMETREYLDSVYAAGTLAVGRQAHALARAVLWPRGTWPVAPATWAHRVITIGLLPAPVREQYGFEWTSKGERTRERLTTMLRVLRRHAPRAMTVWPESRVA